MSDTLVAKRYARALFDLASQGGALTETDNDVSLIAGTMDGSPDLVRMFESPVVSRAKKEVITRELFESRVSATTSDFLSLIIAKRRENIFPRIAQAYRSLRDEQLGVVEATARTASPLTDDDQQGLREILEKITRKRVRLNSEIDESLLGGVSVKVGDTVFDGSIKHKLEELRSTFQMQSSASSN